MELKIDDKKIRELIVEKDENTLIKYKFNDGMIVDTFVYDIDAKKDTIVIPIAVYSLDGRPVKFDYDCEGDGKFEHKGKTG